MHPGASEYLAKWLRAAVTLVSVDLFIHYDQVYQEATKHVVVNACSCHIL